MSKPQPNITATINVIRDKLDIANDVRSNNQIGQVLISLSLICDVLEAQEQRHEQLVNRIDIILNRI